MEYRRDIINVAVVNFKVRACDKASNLSRIREIAAAAARRGADLVLFPEMSLTGCDHFNNPDIPMEEKRPLAETLDGPAVAAVAEIGRQYGVYILFGMPELAPDGDTLYNTAVAVGPEGYAGSYRKIHPWGPENHWCAKGDTPFLLETDWGPVGVGICYDNYQFPELMRHCVYKGARLFLNLSAVVEEVTYSGSREAFIRSYTPQLEYGVLANSIFIASANLAGQDITSFFAGGSMVIGPRMGPFTDPDVVRYCGDDSSSQFGVHLATLDLSLSTRPLCTDNPYTGSPDFRPEVYRDFYRN